MTSPVPPRGGFGWLWGASVGAALGDGLALTVLPLLVASQTRDPVVVSLLQVATGLPWLLFGLVAGTLVDRWDRRDVMWRTDLGRVVVVAALGALVLLDRTPVPVVLLAAFLLATGATLIRSAAPALLPALVGREELASANGRLQAGATVSGSFAGPAIGSGLYAVAAALPLLAQTVSLVVSAFCVRRIPRTPRGPVAPRTPGGIRRETAEGVRWIASHRVLRSVVIGTVMLSAATGILLAVLVLHVLEFLDVPPAGYGALVSVYAIGSLAGALAAARARRLFGTNRCLIAAAALGAFTIGALALAPDVVLAAIALLGLGIATMVWNTVAVTVRQELTPDRLLGRVTSAFNVVGLGAAPVAAPVGGVLAAASGTSAAIGVSAALCVVALVPLLSLPNVDRTAPPQ